MLSNVQKIKNFGFIIKKAKKLQTKPTYVNFKLRFQTQISLPKLGVFKWFLPWWSSTCQDLSNKCSMINPACSKQELCQFE